MTSYNYDGYFVPVSLDTPPTHSFHLYHLTVSFVDCSPRTRGIQVWREMTAQLREAADLFRRAADSGIADASYQLGRLYQQGLGIPLDPVAAFENFLAAAEGSVVHPAAGEGGLGRIWGTRAHSFCNIGRTSQQSL